MSKVTAKDWLEGARLRTLPAAGAPVMIGAASASALATFSPGKSLLALLVALLLQIGVNFANDYSDGIRGTDENRVGPTRLTASGLVPRRTVLTLALTCFALAGVAGLALIWWSGTWWMLIVGILAVIAAWFYTGGKRPYGYLGVGISELMVFVFFGLVATIGTTWVQAYRCPWWLWVLASGMGLASVALLLINNIRDINTDREVGKTTLAVRLGWNATQALLVATLIASVTCAFIGTGNFWVFLVLLGFAAAVVWVSLQARPGDRMLRALKLAGFYALAYGVAVAIALITTPSLP